MNCAAIFLKPRRLLLISDKLYLLLKNIKRPDLAYSKVNQIIPNSGYLLAGCCFSRQSDRETLLSNVKDCHSSKNVNVVDDTKGCVALLNNYTHDTNSSNMKRTSEHNTETTSQETNVENTFISKPQGKKPNTVFDQEFLPPKELGEEKLTFSVINSDLSSDCIINIVSHDDNFEAVASGPPCKKTRIAADDEKVKDKINVKQDLQAAITDSASITTAEKRKEKVKCIKQRPNYFVAIQISNDEIHNNIKHLQNHIIHRDERLTRSMIDVNTLHITLMVMFIGDSETHARAKKALWNIHQDINEGMCKNPLKLEFKGLSHFQNRVLYAKLSTDENYPQLCFIAEKVKKHFAAVSIDTTDSREVFTPHLTVAKINFKDKNRGVKIINPSLYEAYSNQYFGTQKVESIQLLSMTNPKTESGYYSGDIYYFSSFDPSNAKSLSKSLSVEEKKKEIKEMINKLTKENMK